MSGPACEPFVDFYDVLAVGRHAGQEAIHRAYRVLAARLHPDNQHTGDLDGFVLLNRAYEVLSHPQTRRDYDQTFPQAGRRQPPPDETAASMRDFAVGLDYESETRMKILCLLYGRRRADAENPAASLLELEQRLSEPRESLLFAIWYLREKEYVRLDDRSSYLITAAGVDHVEKNLPSNRVIYRLLKDGANSRGPGPHSAGE